MTDLRADAGASPTAAPAADTSAVAAPYVGGIDGLRAIAVGVVLVGHVLPDRPPGGYLGVTVFFAISGYLIARQLHGEATSTSTISLRNFWFRRIRRLAPGALLTLAAVTVTAHWIAVSHTLPWDTRFAAVNLLNWRYVVAETVYGNPFEPLSPVQHFWSLSVEEQFYLVFPLAILGALLVARQRNIDRARAISVIAVIGIASSLAVQFRYQSLSRSYYGTDARLGELCIGVLAAMLLANGRSIPRWAAEASGIVGSAVVAFAVATMGLGSPWLFRGGLEAVATGAALIIVSCNQPTVVGNVLSLPPLRMIGQWSYGIYLAHWPLVVFLPEGSHGLTGARRLAVIAAGSIAFGALLHLGIDGAARRRLRRPTPALVAVWLSATALVIGLTFVPLATSPSISFSVATITAQPNGRIQRAPAVRAPGPPRVVLHGDSVVSSLTFGGIKPTPKSPVETRAWVRLGCDWAVGVSRTRFFRGSPVPVDSECAKWADTLGPALAHDDPDVIALVFGSAISESDVELSSGWAAPCSSEFAQWYTAGQTERIQFLRQHSTASLVMVLPAPAIDTGAGRLEPPDLTRRSECVRQLLGGVARFANIPVIDLAEHTCPRGPSSCTRSDRPDGIHYSPEVGPPTAAWLIDRLRPVIDTNRPR